MRDPKPPELGRAALVIASHPTSTIKLLNLRRMIDCIRATALNLFVVVSVSKGHEDAVKQELAGSGPNLQIVHSPNDRYDTGKWCAGLDALNARAAARRVKYIVLANDSVYLSRTVPELLAALASGKYDVAAPVAAMTGLVGEHYSPSDGYPHGGYHLMSFLRAFRAEALPAWQAYSCVPLANHSSYSSKRHIINYHEVGSSSVYRRERLYAGAVAHKPVLGYPISLPRNFAELASYGSARAAWDPQRFAVGKEGALAWWCPLSYASARLSAWLGETPSTPLGLRNAALESCLRASFGRCEAPASPPPGPEYEWGAAETPLAWNGWAR